MASILTRTLRSTTCRDLRRGILSSPPVWLDSSCINNCDPYKQQNGKNESTFQSKSSCCSTWYLAAAGFVTLNSMPQSSSCSAVEEGEFESGVLHGDGVRNPKIIFVLGGPGSGKSTQCARIVRNYGFTHLSVGDLLRAEVSSGSEVGAMIQRTIKEGSIVPSEVTVRLLQKAMDDSGNDKFLIDGFPRNEENRAAFDTVIGIEPEFVIFFECSEEEMVRRVLNRNQGRADDNVETIRKRFKVFMESNLPIIQYYEDRGKLRKVDATQDKEDVFKSLKPLFTPLIEEDLLRLTKELLQCIDDKDYGIYERLCDPALTAFEPESKGHLVEGLAFHKFYFDLPSRSPAAAPSTSQSMVSAARISLIGEDAALVTYTRLRQSTNADGVPVEEAFNETRVWERKLDSEGKTRMEKRSFPQVKVTPSTIFYRR